VSTIGFCLSDLSFVVVCSFARFFLIRIVGGGLQTGSALHIGHFRPVVPAPGDCEDGEFGGMKIGRGNRSTRRKPSPVTLCPPQIPLDQTRVALHAYFAMLLCSTYFLSTFT
jgi:hypothetical protein